MDAIRRRQSGNYWIRTETYESLKSYIELDFDGLKDAVIVMLGGGRCKINTQKFQNDLTSMKSRDGVLQDYVGDVILAGISYNKKSKQYKCLIERYRAGK